MKDLIVVGNECLDVELYIETIYSRLLESCLEYSVYLNEIYEEGLGESMIKETITEQFRPIFNFLTYSSQVTNASAHHQANLIRGHMEEYINNIDTYDLLLF